MKFLARHLIVDADHTLPIFEVAEGENLADATELLATRIQHTTIHKVFYDPVRGVIHIKSSEHGPNDGAVLQNWPEDYGQVTPEASPAAS